MPKPTKFKKFVLDFGVSNLARELSITDSAIYHWFSGSTNPYRATAIRIQEIARERGVALSLDQILNPHGAANVRGRVPLKPQPARV